MKKSKPKILIFLASIIIISGYLLIGSIIENDKLRNLKLLLNEEQKQLIKKYIFPYKFISQQQKIISQQQQIISKYNQIDWSSNIWCCSSGLSGSKYMNVRC